MLPVKSPCGLKGSLEPFDLIVVGGGCNGTGIARDAAMRGLKVLLLEKNDFSAGTTGASSGMIHGGPRYLQYEVGTTKLACQDANYIRKIAPHLCFRIPFLVPVLREEDPSLLAGLRLELVETFFEAYDRYSPIKGGKPHTRLSKKEAIGLEPCLSEDVIGAVTFDEWGIDTARLCVANALAARENGATVRNHTEVKRILREGNRVVGVVVRNRITGLEEECRGKILFNATGPWVPKLCEMAGVQVRLRPAKGIHLILDRRITNVAVVSKAIDGRQIFINPHENTTLVGTTDDDYYGDLDDIPVTEDEVEYLLQGMERVYPDIRKARIISTWRGVRPTLWGEDVYEDELSREHEIFDHETRDGVSGLLTMAGGKLASYRIMAEEATDLVCRKLGVTAPCRTHVVPLPGGGSVPDPREIAKEFQIDPYVARRLISRHGSLVRSVLKETKEHPAEKSVVCTNEPVIAAEIRYAIREEWAMTLGDLLRRTRLAMGPCQGTDCLLPAVQILAEERSLPADEKIRELKTFLDQSWTARRAILKGPQLAQEEMMQEVFQGVLDLGNL